MRFDTVIIGGGLSGLTAGIRLAEQGRKVAIISSGQSTLHFFSGSLELLGATDAGDVKSPFGAISSLPPTHPYSLIGEEKMRQLAGPAVELLRRSGLRFEGGGDTNHCHLTPFGIVKSSWISLDDCLTFASPDNFPFKHVGLVNISGYLDFYPQFLALGLDKMGVRSTALSVTSPQLQAMRKSSTEMRAPNMARVMTPATVGCIAEFLNEIDAAVEAFIMPAIFGLNDTVALDDLRSRVRRPVYFIPTMPTSVPGVRSQIMLRERFKALGGNYLLGDSVTGGEIEGNALRYVTTSNLGEDRLEADNFILATGSFLRHGIKATPSRIYEPIFGLDVVSPADRAVWFSDNFYQQQPYMNCGVVNDASFRLSRDGVTVSNLFGIGSVLSGSNPVTLSCGGGVALFTALHVADTILNSK